MEKCAVILLIAALLLPASGNYGAGAATEKTGVVTAYELYIRTGPGTEYDNIMVGDAKAVLKRDQEITIFGEENDWYHVRAVVDGELVEGYSLSGKDGVVYIELKDTAQDTDPAGDDEGKAGKKDEKSGDADAKTGSENETSGDDADSKADKPGDATDEKTGDSDDKSGKDSGKSDNGKDEKSEEEEFDPTDLSQEIPEGYELGKQSWSAKYNYVGTVSAKTGLNMRKSAKTGAKVRAVLQYGQEVVIINSKIVTTKDDKGTSVKTRWYRVIANTGGKYEAGYVMSDYVTLDCGEGIAAQCNYKKQVLLKKAKDGSAKVKYESGKLVRLAKKKAVTIIGDVIGNDGTHYFKVAVEVAGNEYKGYIPALRISFVPNTTSYSVNILVESEPDAEVDKETADEPEPPVLSFEEANAVIKDSAGLAVNRTPQSTAERLFTDNNTLIKLYDGDSVQVIETVTDGDFTWCYIRFYYNSTEYFGYVRSVYVESLNSEISEETMSQTTASERGFEEKLEAEGFPESYKVLLRELHGEYPAWEFKAFHTGLDWEEAIAAESVVGINLIPNSYSVEWKSLEAGAYSWKTDAFTVFDGSSWVTASNDAVRFYMDPRNFLTAERIFQFEILTYSPQFQDRAGVANILKNTALSGTSYKYTDDKGNSHDVSYEDTFIMAAEYTGVSPFHLASRVKQEVTIGTSALSNSVTGTVEGYEGIYNFYNIGAYHSTVAGGAIRNGLKFATSGSSNASVLIPWTDPYRAILGGAFYIGNNYINRGQNTIYLQKFNATPNNTYAHQYMANVEAPYSEGVRVYRGYENPGEIPVVFSIPVYENMPEEASPRPEKQYNPNNWLKTLKIYNIDGEKLALTPTFDYTVDQEYSLIVDSATDCLKIKATTVSTLAKIVSDKKVSLNTGLNRVTVQVEAENGDIRDYVINVVREEGAEQEDTAKEESGTDDTAVSGDLTDTGSEASDQTDAPDAGTDADTAASDVVTDDGVGSENAADENAAKSDDEG